MNKAFIKSICILGISTLILCGCSNKDTDKNEQQSHDKPTVSENNGQATDDNNKSHENNDSTKGEETKVTLNKQEYLDKMNTLDEDLNTRLKDKLAGTTLDMSEAESEIYTEWDNMLNEIYVLIIDTLSESEKDNLINEEKAWIVERDEKADDAAKEVEGGTIEPLIRIGTLGSSTKERCYELVNTYMQ